MSSPGSVNALTKVFNAPGQTFNDRTLSTPTYLKPAPASTPPNPPDMVPDGTMVRRNFDDFVPFRAEAAPPPVLRRQTVVGNFSAVRAARILHQYDINFWSDTDVQAALNNPPPPIYSQDVLQQMYNDFLLFNYLPDAITPTLSEFTAIVQPSGDVAESLGLTPKTLDLQLATADDSLLPSPLPFGEVLSPFCQLASMRTVRNA